MTPAWNVPAEELPSLTVIVPARDEEKNIGATIESLLASEYGPLRIIAVDDRSLDGTGRIIDRFAAAAPDRLHALHISELPTGWLGKTWAMESALQITSSEWVLFTDADVIFEPSILRRAVAYAERERADHVVVAPTLLVRSTGEGMLLGFFQVFGALTSRPWLVANPKAKYAAVGVGAFNMVRRSALERINGLHPQRMSVLEDMTLARRLRAAGFPQRISSAPGMVRVHWAAGASGLVGVLTKNLFSSLNFNSALLLLVVTWILLLGLLPVVGLLSLATLVPALVMAGCIAITYVRLEPATCIPARYGWLFPLGALTFAWALIRSTLAVWIRGGVVWRGTHYPLREMRRHNSPFQW